MREYVQKGQTELSGAGEELRMPDITDLHQVAVPEIRRSRLDFAGHTFAVSGEQFAIKLACSLTGAPELDPAAATQVLQDAGITISGETNVSFSAEDIEKIDEALIRSAEARGKEPTHNFETVLRLSIAAPMG